MVWGATALGRSARQTGRAAGADSPPAAPHTGDALLVGLISDTHGLLRPEVIDCFRNVARILHAGDIGHAGILDRLEAMAPVTAVFGNTDGVDVRRRVSKTARVELQGWGVLVTYGHELGTPTPAALRQAHPDADIIVYGHTHRALVDQADRPLVVNPGAAGPTRFRLHPSLALLTLTAAGPGGVEVHIIEIAPTRPGA